MHFLSISNATLGLMIVACIWSFRGGVADLIGLVMRKGGSFGGQLAKSPIYNNLSCRIVDIKMSTIKLI